MAPASRTGIYPVRLFYPKLAKGFAKLSNVVRALLFSRFFPSPLPHRDLPKVRYFTANLLDIQ